MIESVPIEGALPLSLSSLIDAVDSLEHFAIDVDRNRHLDDEKSRRAMLVLRANCNDF